VELEDLPEEIRYTRPEPSSSGSVRPLDDIEKEYILASLALNEGNQTRTAEQLRIGSATLYRKLKSYGLIGKSRTATRRRRDSRGLHTR
jgi:DNA-binding NtrC family response regulator